MPIDARIPLQALANPQQPIDLMGMARQAAALHAERAQAQQQARAQQGQQALQMAIQEADGDYDRAAELLDARGFGDVSVSFREKVAKARTESYAALDKQLSTRSNELKLFGSLADLITDEQSMQTVVGALSPQLQQLAIQNLGRTYDPAKVDSLRTQLLTESDRANRKKQAFDELVKSREWDAKAPERRLTEVTAMGQYLSAAQTPEEYQETIQAAPLLGISPDVVKLFAGKTPEQAAQITLTAKERAELQGAAADDTRADRALENTIAVNQAQLDISRGNLGVARGNLALRRQEAAAEGGTAKPTAADAELVDAILKNPSIYAGLTPTVKTRLAAQLARRGFTGFASGSEVTKLSAAVAEKVAGLEQGLSILSELESLKQDNWLGPAAGRFTEMKINTPGVDVPDNLAKFAAQTATLRNSVVKAITGAQMSEPEAKRIMQQVPLFTDKPSVWKQKLDATRQNMTVMRRRMLELSGVPQAGAAPSGPAKVGRFTVREK